MMSLYNPYILPCSTKTESAIVGSLPLNGRIINDYFFPNSLGERVQGGYDLGQIFWEIVVCRQLRPLGPQSSHRKHLVPYGWIYRNAFFQIVSARS